MDYFDDNYDPFGGLNDTRNIIQEYLFTQDFPYKVVPHATAKQGYDRFISRYGVKVGPQDQLRAIATAWQDNDPNYEFAVQQPVHVKRRQDRYAFGWHQQDRVTKEPDVAKGFEKPDKPKEGKRTGSNKVRVGHEFTPEPGAQRKPENSKARFKRVITGESVQESKGWLHYHYWGDQYTNTQNEMTTQTDIGSYEMPLWYCKGRGCKYHVTAKLLPFGRYICPVCGEHLVTDSEGNTEHNGD